MKIEGWMTKNIFYNEDEREKARKHIDKLVANGWSDEGDSVDFEYLYCTQLIKNTS